VKHPTNGVENKVGGVKYASIRVNHALSGVNHRVNGAANAGFGVNHVGEAIFYVPGGVIYEALPVTDAVYPVFNR
jgi:hypothetical protein